ncbi:EamA family transporter [Idiomarina loihiensis]|uniref:EamA family transporter n=1 Tax=Idiomarina TaxID=135575 RepID=UPI000D70E58B|nr:MULTISPECIES: EamA family transporter [Idiomarina]MRJ43668.1 EamA family transporter [Idiomarina loihiensis]PWW41392.1 carboxylate/amino acid/amine transporter [Idiomarina loihiensis]TDP50450.1 carboxylate/amino acid/amine transporter [Idiomarina loihiensis]TDS25272.1 carboxylate/amino acid/amine transporter [Idiomarina sp. H2]UTW34194.1 EamA family transporter [Idiomarina loihiensis]
MTLLILITLLWAASFSLIGVYLAGQVDGYLVVFIRMILALITVLPLFRWRHLSPQNGQLPQLAKLAVIGAVQIGAMYLFLYHAFLYLSVAEVLLFTIFTPLYITLIDELILNRKHLPLLWWIAAAVSVCGAAIIRYQPLSDDFITGFFLIQAANACFAAGQVAYKRLPTGKTLEQSQQFAAFFFGASVIAGLGVLFFGDLTKMPTTNLQWGILLWLGIVASGLGYLGWNLSGKRVNTGQLATMNNALIPAGILVNVIFWEQSFDYTRLSIGALIIILAVWLAGRVNKLKPAR